MSDKDIKLAPGQTRVEWLVGRLIGAIEQGRYLPGSRVPSIRRTAADAGLSPFTVADAYDRLVTRGYLSARRGAGYYVEARQVTPPPRPAVLDELPIDDSWLLRSVYETRQLGVRAGCGWLPAGWYDDEAQQRALRALARGGIVGDHYGEPKGYGALRAELARQLAERGIPTGPEQLVLTQGASKALDMVACTLARPGDTLLVDDPGYCNLISCLTFRGFKLVGVPWTAQGPDTAALEALLAEHRPRAYFTNPWLHNPTGASYTLPVAHRVLKLAEQHNFWIVEDNVSADLCAERTPSLAALDGLSRVLYIGSFSKTLSPGLRVGFIAAPTEPVERLVRYKMLSGLTTPELNERLALALVSDGRYRRQVERLRQRLAGAQARVGRRLQELGWTLFTQPTGGLFLLARPPRDVDPQALAESAQAEDILLAPGRLFRPHGAASPWLRFNVAYSDDEKLWRFLARSVEQTAD
ncbi:PLP-dependent aminotransferase family protein [Crenobacter sp. SG2303]|uniref:Putative 8-amino-7-oxononanoate synthase n=1 Tax=Crenobacter oryzisoli TaxID=3056844 RepID=A0ABT7XQ36_9NEIS|nr:PLP-dependent aminotransferase family protein [Crenobacter sp. SG2303]MDN0075900.1 PLP-dependent aminotransferase family protein [Crenobacter sp. SG2303]